jgi:hypothetical protein
MSILDDIASMTAELERIEDAPTGDLKYGRDLSCVSDLSPDFTEVDPASPLGMAQSSVRRLITPRGVLPDDADYGLDIRAYSNRGMTASELRDLAGQIRNELVKDDRVDTADASITQERTSMSIFVQLTPVDPAVRQFTFTLSVTSTEVLLETIQ